MCLKSDLGVKTIHFTETHFHFVMSLCKCQAFSKKWIKSLRRKKTNSRNTHLFHKCIKKSIKMSHQTCKWGKSTLSHIPFITWQHAARITSVSCRGVSDMVVFFFLSWLILDHGILRAACEHHWRKGRMKERDRITELIKDSRCLTFSSCIQALPL